MEPVQWTLESIDVNYDSNPTELRDVADFLSKKLVDLVINLPRRNVDSRRLSSLLTHGYRTRRLAVDCSIPLVTDVKCAKLLVEVGHDYMLILKDRSVYEYCLFNMLFDLLSILI